MQKLGILSSVSSRPARHQRITSGHPWKEPQSTGSGNGSLLGGGGGVDWTEKPQVMEMEILTHSLHLVFLSLPRQLRELYVWLCQHWPPTHGQRWPGRALAHFTGRPLLPQPRCSMIALFKSVPGVPWKAPGDTPDLSSKPYCTAHS